MRHRARPITKADETPEFIAFWEAWRKKARHTDGRGLARDTFFAHVADGADPQDIVDGAMWFLRGMKDREYVPLSSTWLNRRAYEDLADMERDLQAKRAERIASAAIEDARRKPAPVSIDEERRQQHAARVRAEAGLGPLGA